jgi:hypothetical protein
MNYEGENMKKQKKCRKCKKDMPIAIIFNTNALTIAQYFTWVEDGKKMGLCPDCFLKLQNSSSVPKYKTKFTVKHGWFIWDRETKTLARGRFEHKKDALECAKKMEEEYISREIADEL